jgi:hypothetical protein
MTEAFRVYLVEWDSEAVKGGGARPEGLGSMGAVSTGDAAVEARRIWRAETQVLQRWVDGPETC